MYIKGFCMLMLGFLLLPTEDKKPLPKPCNNPFIYENHNQVDYGPLTVSKISGRVLVESDSPPKEVGPDDETCLGLFTEKKHKLIAVTVTDKDGHYDFGPVQPGRYRLIAKDNLFCPANVPIIVVKSTKDKKFEDREI